MHASQIRKLYSLVRWHAHVLMTVPDQIHHTHVKQALLEQQLNFTGRVVLSTGSSHARVHVQMCDSQSRRYTC